MFRPQDGAFSRAGYGRRMPPRLSSWSLGLPVHSKGEGKRLRTKVPGSHDEHNGGMETPTKSRSTVYDECMRVKQRIANTQTLLVQNTSDSNSAAHQSHFFPFPHVNFSSRPFVVYSKSPRNMLIFLNSLLTPLTHCYLSTQKPFSLKASHPPPAPTRSPVQVQNAPLPWGFVGLIKC